MRHCHLRLNTSISKVAILILHSPAQKYALGVRGAQRGQWKSQYSPLRPKPMKFVDVRRIICEQDAMERNSDATKVERVSISPY